MNNNSRKEINLIYLFLGLLVISLSSCSKKLIPVQKIIFSDNPINICIDSSSSFIGPCEPSICINPRDPSKLVAGSVLNNVYRSADGGYTWTADKLTSPYGVYGDPTIRYDNKGNVYFAHLSNPAGIAYQDSSFLDRIVIQKSMDNGQNWNKGSYTTPTNKRDQDKQWPAIDWNNNTIYMTWTEFDKYDSPLPEHESRILFTKSEDGATTWTEPKVISDLSGDCLDDDHTAEGAVPAVGPNGELYVSWAINEKIYFDRSLDGGKSWLKNDIHIADQIGGWALDIPGIMRCNGMPITATDISNGNYRGNVYVNYSDQRNGNNDTDIWIVKSDDNGKTWGKPIRVNDDKPGKHQFLSWMTVDPISGYIYIVFYDRRNHDDNATDVYLAYSTDGGSSFTNKKISAAPFYPNNLVFFGDYNDISAYNGQVRPIWTSLDKNQLKVWTAIIELN